MAANRLLGETLLSLSQAATRFPPARLGRPVSPSCVWRWCRHGVHTLDGRRVFLEHALLVNRHVTSAEAVARFLEAVQPLDQTQPLVTQPVRSPGKRRRASERA